jgi:hypothetical protein
MEVNMKLLAFAALLPLVCCFAAVPDSSIPHAQPDNTVAAPVAALPVEASPQPKTIEIASAPIAAGTNASFQNSGAAPGQTGATPARKTKKRSETKTFLWVMGGIAAAALAIGLTAAAQGKSPF